MKRTAAVGVMWAVGSGLIAAVCVAADEPLATTWLKAARMLPAEAYREFAAAPASREVLLGRAVTLLNVPPVAPGNLERAATWLESLRGDDEVGIAATYFLARLEQVHRMPPNPERALALYEELYRRHPQHALAQMGWVKAAIGRVYEPGVDFAAIERSGEGLTDPQAVRDFHLALADAAGRLRLPAEKQLEHLLAVDRVGMARRKTSGDVWVRIAELARETGRRELAREYARRFLAEFPNDQRAHLVRERLGR